MSYVKAHPFGYKPSPRSGEVTDIPFDKKNKQTITEQTSYKVMRRQKVWERDPVTGKMKMKLVPVTETKLVKGRKVEVPVYDTFTGTQTRQLKHYGRIKRGRTLSQIVYENFPVNEE